MLSRASVSPFKGAACRTFPKRACRTWNGRTLIACQPPKSTPQRPFTQSAPRASDNYFRKVTDTAPSAVRDRQARTSKKTPSPSDAEPAGAKVTDAEETVSLESILASNQVSKGRPNLWLRDACQCDKCVDPHSGQKSFATSQLDFLPHAKSVERHDDGSLTVVWANDPVSGGEDHTSVYPPNIGDGYHKFPRRDIWNRDIFEQEREKCRVSYDDWMAGGSEFWAAMAALSSKGLVFVYDVPQGDEQAVERLGEQIGALQETFYGRTWDVVSKPRAENVAYTNQFLGLHQDLLYYPDPPRVQLLHCLANECEGGESLFADGVYAATLMAATREASFQALATQPTAYHYNKNGNVYYAERPIVRSKPGKQAAVVENVWWSPPFQAPFPVDNADMASWYLAARQFQAEIERPEHTVEYRLRPGECVVFDNWRVLHGRRQFNASSGRRHLKGAYVDDRTYRAKLGDMPSPLAREHRLWANRFSEFNRNDAVVRRRQNARLARLTDQERVAASLIRREREGTLYRRSTPGLVRGLLGDAHPAMQPQRVPIQPAEEP